MHPTESKFHKASSKISERVALVMVSCLLSLTWLTEANSCGINYIPQIVIFYFVIVCHPILVVFFIAASRCTS